LAIDIRRVEELSMNAWPAPRQVAHDGWVLRFGGGYTGRANSVHPLYDGSLDVGDKIEFCDRAYRRVGLPLLFKMTAAARPADLDYVLERRGYRAFNHTSVQVKPLDDVADREANDDGITSFDRVDARWLEPVVAFRAIPPDHAAVLRSILGALCLPARFSTLSEGGQPVACGLAVVEGEWVGLFDIVTRAESQRRGYATRMMNDLLKWARAVGARKAYLQVTRTNTPALRLYEKLDFREAYSYWYRAKGK
jgi:GNAT superfamily N-acetyltransferase